MSVISRITTWSDGQVLTASALNGEFNNILNDYNGGITDANISNSAAISTSKINKTFPSGAIVGDTDIQTLTQKTLTAPTINNPTVKASVQIVTAMSAQALDGSTANIFTRTLAGSEVFTQSNFTAGQVFMVEVKQGTGTSYTVTWFSGITWVTSGGTAPVQTTTTNGYTTYGFRCTGTNTFLGYLIGTQ